MADALEAIAPSTHSVDYAGQRLEIQPLTVGQIPGVVRRARPVINAVMALEAVSDEDEEALLDLALDLVESRGDEVFEAVALMTGAEVELVKRGSLDEFVRLAMTVYRVNRDFFAQRLAPLVAEWRAGKRGGAGKTPSTPSSPPDTH